MLQSFPVLEKDGILDLENMSPSGEGDPQNSLRKVVQEDKNNESPKAASVDSNGPVETLGTPLKNQENQVAQSELVDLQDNEPTPNKEQGNEPPQPKIVNMQGNGLEKEQESLNRTPQNIIQKIPDLTDDEGSEILENKIAENMNMQTERLFDIIEDLQRIIRTQWSNCKDVKTATNTLKFMMERANRVKSHSMDLPEFLERRPLQDQQGYEYIGRMNKAWIQMKELFEMARNLLCSLPSSYGEIIKRNDVKASSGSSVLSDLKEKNAVKAKELANRAQSIMANSAVDRFRKPSTPSSVVSVLKGKNVIKNKELDKRALATAKADANIKELYGSEGGKALNKILGSFQPPKRKEDQGQNSKNAVPQHNYGSLDGDLQILDRTNAWVNADPKSTYQPKILPRGKKLEEFREEHPSIQEPIPRNRNFNIKPREPRPYVKVLDAKSDAPEEPIHGNQNFNPRGPRPNVRVWNARSDVIGPEDSVSQHSRRHIYDRPEPFRPGYRQNKYDFPEPKWYSVSTKKHPEEEKPIHYGKIKSFRQLFENAFDMNYLFDPMAKERSEKLKPVRFDGNNVELFKEFEQSVLIRIINNNSSDFDEKFLALLDTLSGSPLAVVQSYTEKLDVCNFVKAIEDLYYAYGEDNKFRDALLRQLMNEEPVDVKRPETLLKLRALIGRVFRAFGGDTKGNHVLSTSFVMESIRMTPEASLSYKAWLCSTRTKKSLKAFEEWLEWEYSQDMEDVLKQKTSRGYKNLKRQPILNNALEVMEEIQEPEKAQVLWTPESSQVKEAKDNSEIARQDDPVLMSTGQAKIMEKRCQLCFGEPHKFANCRVFMNMTPDQRKIALLIRDGCFRCTGIGHIGSKCLSKMNCQKCQNSEHHETICEASLDSWNAVISKKWDNSKNLKESPIPKPRKETEVKKTFLVQGEDLQ